MLPAGGGGAAERAPCSSMRPPPKHPLLTFLLMYLVLYKERIQ